jgi:hypothetical protein
VVIDGKTDEHAFSRSSLEGIEADLARERAVVCPGQALREP